MRVLIAGNYSRNLPIFRGALINELTRAGHSVTTVGPEDDPWVRVQLEQLKADFRWLPMARASINPLGDLAYMIKLTRLIRDVGPDVILTFTHKPNVFGSFAGALAGNRPVVVLVEGLGYSFIEARGLRKRLAQLGIRMLYRLSLRFCRHAVFLNGDDLRLFRDSRLLPKGLACEVIDGIGVDLDRFRCRPCPSLCLVSCWSPACCGQKVSWSTVKRRGLFAKSIEASISALSERRTPVRIGWMPRSW